MGQGLSLARAQPEARHLGKGLSPGPARARSEKPGGLKGSKNIIFIWKRVNF